MAKININSDVILKHAYNINEMKQRKKKATRYNELRRLTRSGLSKQVNNTYTKWASEHYKYSKYSQMEDLPSSQLVSKASLIKENEAQLFVVIDTCSIIHYRERFLSFLIRQKKLFPNSPPIRFILTVPVLEELDKHSKRPRNKRPDKGQIKEENKSVIRTENKSEPSEDLDLVNIVKGINSDVYTPRYLFRIIEEETRTNGVLISDLDPANKTKLGEADQDFEIVNNDDRILQRCLVFRKFINDLAHHKDTKVVLVAEDNIFKIKATTREIISYRWSEFECKYKNFGLKNCNPTPMVLPMTSRLRLKNDYHDNKILEINIEDSNNKVGQLANDKDDEIIFVEEIIKL